MLYVALFLQTIHFALDDFPKRIRLVVVTDYAGG